MLMVTLLKTILSMHNRLGYVPFLIKLQCLDNPSDPSKTHSDKIREYATWLPGISPEMCGN